MDILPEQLNLWLQSYGAFALFTLLAMGIIALPIPEETLLVFTGWLLSQDKMSLWTTLPAAYLGSMSGITVSYIIGRTGLHYIILQYGKYVGLNESKLSTAHTWFERYGKWLLVIGYFIPGLRHFTGIFAGISELEYRIFSFYAYLGAILWVTTFLSLGYFFGNFHQEFLALLESHVEVVVESAIVVLIAVILIRWTWWSDSGQ